MRFSTSRESRYQSMQGSSTRALPPLAAQTPTESVDESLNVPMFRGDSARTGANIGPAPKAPVDIIWETTRQGAINGSPAIVNNTVFAAWGSSNQATEGVVCALDAKTGVERWSFGIDTPFHSSPAVVDGVVYVGSNHGYLHAIDAETGVEIWRFTAGDSVNNDPAVENGSVFFTSSNNILYAVDTETGLEKWRFEIESSSSRSAPSVAEGVVYIGSWSDLKLYAVDAETGSELWHLEDKDRLPNTPAVKNDTVFALTDGGVLLAIEAGSGEEIWRFVASGFEGTRDIVVGEDTLYYDDGAQILAVNLVDRTERWRIAEASRRSMTLSGSTLFAGVDSGQLIAIDADSGAELWSFDSEGWSAVQYPAIYDGIAYVGTESGTLYALGNGQPVEEGTDNIDEEMFVTAVIAEQVVMRPFPGETDYEVLTLYVGDQVELGADPSTELYDGVVWIYVTTEMHFGWIPLSSLDPETLPPELVELLGAETEGSSENQSASSDQGASEFSLMIEDTDLRWEASTDDFSISGEISAGTEVEIDTEYSGITYADGTDWVYVTVIEDGSPWGDSGWVPLASLDQDTLPPDLQFTYLVLTETVVVRYSPGENAEEVAEVPAGEKVQANSLFTETVDGVEWAHIYVIDMEIGGYVPMEILGSPDPL